LVPLPPIVVLEPEDTCWAFSGSSGYITIQLARPAYLKKVSIVHPVRSNDSVGSAPREVAVWALIDPKLAQGVDAPARPPLPLPFVSASPSRLSTVFLGQFQYNLTSELVNQSFVVDPVLNYHRIKVDKVLFQVVNNWELHSRVCTVFASLDFSYQV